MKRSIFSVLEQEFSGLLAERFVSSLEEKAVFILSDEESYFYLKKLDLPGALISITRTLLELVTVLKKILRRKIRILIVNRFSLKVSRYVQRPPLEELLYLLSKIKGDFVYLSRHLPGIRLAGIKQYSIKYLGQNKYLVKTDEENEAIFEVVTVS